ncbi:NAD-dependent protein deacetylase of SIR2 family [Serinicoccus hydrothermalis]|uniref:NAD-dependent protein deacetylase n=1 Tax=Serinicoccus hydrothermalis TaxID=1758689 RepID=A0A1B1NA98_9MICO|nr:Sir2 family NAD-dependent protein deacetylase [Serinicoccus hydrothermalis]ANS78363.1 NAD-dependent protein deacetylase of SIR2 family [Serinicoccus hydrothermalis]
MSAVGPLDAALTVPAPAVVEPGAYARLRELVAGGGAVALTGAGMSTASGIPDYRGPDGTRRVQPMQHGEFVGSAAARQRYWARAYVGWTRFASARPNPAHRAVADLERLGLVRHVITQNVDGLHQQAGSHRVLELHGTLDRVVCLDCGEVTTRDQVQEWLADANPGFLVAVDATSPVRPDGDVALPEAQVQAFRPPLCLVCGRDRLKPDVVFFGGSVDKGVVERAYTFVEQARVLLVLGSSLQVMSGYRFVRRAAREGIPVAVVTRGGTRGDAETTVGVDALVGDVLPALVADLRG